MDDVPDERGVLFEVLRVDGTDKEINDAEYGDPPEGYDLLVTGHEIFGRVLEAGPTCKVSKPDDYVVATVKRPVTNIRCCRGERSCLIRDLGNTLHRMLL